MVALSLVAVATAGSLTRAARHVLDDIARVQGAHGAHVRVVEEPAARIGELAAAEKSRLAPSPDRTVLLEHLGLVPPGWAPQAVASPMVAFYDAAAHTLHISPEVNLRAPGHLLAFATAAEDGRWRLMAEKPAATLDEELARRLVGEGSGWWALGRYIAAGAGGDPGLVDQWTNLGKAVSNGMFAGLTGPRYGLLSDWLSTGGLALRAASGATATGKDPSIGWMEALRRGELSTAACFGEPTAPLSVDVRRLHPTYVDRVGEVGTAFAVETPDHLPYLLGTWTNGAGSGLEADAWVAFPNADGTPAYAWITQWHTVDDRIQYALAWRHAQPEVAATLTWLGERSAVTTWNVDPHVVIAALGG